MSNIIRNLKRSSEDKIRRYKNKLKKLEQQYEQSTGNKNICSDNKNEDLGDTSGSTGSDDDPLFAVPSINKPPSIHKEQQSENDLVNTVKSLVALNHGELKKAKHNLGNELAKNLKNESTKGPETPQVNIHRELEQREKRNSKNNPKNILNEQPTTETSQRRNTEKNNELERSMDALFRTNIHPKLTLSPLKGLHEQRKEISISEYVTPDTCKLLKTPTLHDDVSVVTQNQARNQAQLLQKKQDPQNLAIMADRPQKNVCRELQHSEIHNSTIKPTTLETLQSTDAKNKNNRSVKLLNALEDDISSISDNIDTKLVDLWSPILQKGLQEHRKDTYMKIYATPDNCKLLKAPYLNDEISVVIGNHVRHRDDRLRRKQEQLGLAITAIGKGISLLINQAAISSGNTAELKTAMIHFNRGSCLLADLHFHQSQHRRYLSCCNNSNLRRVFQETICKNDKVDKLDFNKFFHTLDKNITRDDTLYGHKVGKIVKRSKLASLDYQQLLSTTHNLVSK